AHTVLRQKRCDTRYINNGAVYYEPVVRLVDWNNWITGRFGGASKGRSWLANTPYAFVNVETEVEYWRRANITRYAVQYSNRYLYGVSETLGVENALGVTQDISIKRAVSQFRSGGWTTVWMYFGLWNDLLISGTYGYSFLLNDPGNQRFTPPCRYSDYLTSPDDYSCDPCDLAWNPDAFNCYPNHELLLSFPDTPSFQLVHSNIGPLNSIDTYFIRAPPSLIQLHTTFRASVAQLVISNNMFAARMNAIPTLSSDPIPPSWLDPSFMYMGGDPTCLFHQPSNFVQTSFAFDVSCTSEDSQAILLTPSTTLFALWATSKAAETTLCNVCPTLNATCSEVFGQTAKANIIFSQFYPPNSSLFVSLIQSAYKEILDLNLSIIQFAINTTDQSNVFLQQRVLGGQDAAQWDVFGWMYLYDWVEGYREVVAFEGDANAIPLISNKNDPIVDEAQILEIPNSACKYLWAVAVVVTSVLVLVGVFVTCYSIHLRGRVVGRNLFQFNRVVGAVWLSRPLLFVRGLTAIILLSTSPLRFQTINGYAYLEFHPRTFFESMLVASEATWVSYIAYDFVLVMTHKTNAHVAPFTSYIAWLVLIGIDVASPYRIEAKLNQQCTIDLVKRSIACTSGKILVGSSSRAILLVVIQVTVVIAASVLVKASRWRRKVPVSLHSDHLFLSGTALGFLHNLSSGDNWILDRASCVMCGLITFKNTIFDIKLWLLVPDDSASTTRVKWCMKMFENTKLDLRTKVKTLEALISSVPSVDKSITLRHHIITLAGFLYVISTIFGSITYLSLTKTNMANDFWWANYNATRDHVFVTRLFNEQLNKRPHIGSISVSDTKFIDDANYTIDLSPGVPIIMKPLYVSQILLDDGVDLGVVIRGLRVMDACLAPWISSQYCWLDFEKKWEMANSLTRLIRCTSNYSTNAAVYLESVLRNVKWSQFMSCWGTSLESAFASPLNKLQMELHGGLMFSP
ncbi:hypothetical protein AeRB84_006868, partial [Aphanomyces euteiches]